MLLSFNDLLIDENTGRRGPHALYTSRWRCHIDGEARRRRSDERTDVARATLDARAQSAVR